VVHYSDHGVLQHAAREYTELLERHGMIPSMSRPANTSDNAACERFMKTLKEEEIQCREYRDLEDLRAHMEEFMERYYNQQRLHSALKYHTPEEFERNRSSSEAMPARIRVVQQPAGGAQEGESRVRWTDAVDGRGRQPLAGPFGFVISGCFSILGGRKKHEGALGKRFLRHDGIYRADVSFLLFTPGAYPASRSGAAARV
jgi:Integrase core domain